jgi:hypothetical protein
MRYGDEPGAEIPGEPRGSAREQEQPEQDEDQVFPRRVAPPSARRMRLSPQ